MADDDALRRQDVTCQRCGARSRAGYRVPEGRQCIVQATEDTMGYEGWHDWQPTAEVAPDA